MITPTMILPSGGACPPHVSPAGSARVNVMGTLPLALPALRCMGMRMHIPPYHLCIIVNRLIYSTECIYDPSSDHRRKGVYRTDVNGHKAQSSTLQTLVSALLNLEEQDAVDLLREMRTCQSLDSVAERLSADENAMKAIDIADGAPNSDVGSVDSILEKQVYGKMADLQLDEGGVRYIGVSTQYTVHRLRHLLNLLLFGSKGHLEPLAYR
jgi:uncharacterized protein YerC